MNFLKIAYIKITKETLVTPSGQKQWFNSFTGNGSEWNSESLWRESSNYPRAVDLIAIWSSGVVCTFSSFLLFCQLLFWSHSYLLPGVPIKVKYEILVVSSSLDWAEVWGKRGRESDQWVSHWQGDNCDKSLSKWRKHTDIRTRAYTALKTPSAKAPRPPSVSNVEAIQRIPTRWELRV